MTHGYKTEFTFCKNTKCPYNSPINPEGKEHEKYGFCRQAMWDTMQKEGLIEITPKDISRFTNPSDISIKILNKN